MNYRRITNFDDVILFTLQQNLSIGKPAVLSFGEIINICENAGRKFIVPVMMNKNRKEFFARIFDALKMLSLEEKVNVHTTPDEKIERVELTEIGIEMMRTIVFTGQEVMR
jgi:hypothetical protein